MQQITIDNAFLVVNSLKKCCVADRCSSACHNLPEESIFIKTLTVSGAQALTVIWSVVAAAKAAEWQGFLREQRNKGTGSYLLVLGASLFPRNWRPKDPKLSR